MAYQESTTILLHIRFNKEIICYKIQKNIFIDNKLPAASHGIYTGHSEKPKRLIRNPDFHLSRNDMNEARLRRALRCGKLDPKKE